MDTIRIRGARTQGLEGIDLDLPRKQPIVITGPPGSGKPSLALDTIQAEGRCRRVESLSSCAPPPPAPDPRRHPPHRQGAPAPAQAIAAESIGDPHLPALPKRGPLRSGCKSGTSPNWLDTCSGGARPAQAVSERTASARKIQYFEVRKFSTPPATEPTATPIAGQAHTSDDRATSAA